MKKQEITVTIEADYLRLRSGRPENFGLDYHIQHDDYLCLELPDNPLKIDIFFIGLKNHPQAHVIVRLVATPYLDMLMEGQAAPVWTQPVEHASEGGLLLRYL